MISLITHPADIYLFIYFVYIMVLQLLNFSQKLRLTIKDIYGSQPSKHVPIQSQQ